MTSPAMAATAAPVLRWLPPMKENAVMNIPTAMPAVPPISSGRRPVRSSSRIAMMVRPTLTAPMPTLASSAAEEPRPASCSRDGA